MDARFLGLAASAAALALMACQSFAQTYPSRPIRLVSQHPPGSAPDTVMRAALQELSPRLGQPIVIESRPSMNGIIAIESCSKAAPDGHTLCLATSNTMSFNPHLFSKLPYDPEKDFRPVARLFVLVQALMATATLPADTVKELQHVATSKPGWLNFGTIGSGSQPDVFRQFLGDRWQTNITGIPYKGGVSLANALAAGEVHVSMLGIGSAAGALRGGKVKLLAIGALKRFARFPDVPLLSELGVDFPVLVFWGISVPAGAPDAVVGRLNAELVRLFREPRFNEVLDNHYCEQAVGTPEEFAAFLKRDREQAGRLVTKYNIPRE